MNYSNYIFFWGIKNKNGYLSNFYPTNFTYNSEIYNCSEQYFIKMKQETFDPTNINLGKLIMNETKPSNIKKYGRMVKNYNDEKWGSIRYSVMIDALTLKFTQNKTLLNNLLSTKDMILVEASPFDKIWGIGLNETNAKKICPVKWKGKNLLGKALMEVREKLKKKN